MAIVHFLKNKKKLTKKYFFSWYKYKMHKVFLKFSEIELEKRESDDSTRAIAISNVNINKIILSDRFSCSKNSSKFFVSYKNNEKVRPLCVSCSKQLVNM